MGGGHGLLGGHMAGTWLQGENVLISVCCRGWEGVGGLFFGSVL